MMAPHASPAAALPDAVARRRIREDLDSTLVVEAAAGTGKTSELVRRIAAVLASGRTTLDRIVAVTFTEKAAGEMKLRLRAEIESARTRAAADPAIRDRFDAALGALEAARIGTIHGFCSDLLRERPVEASIDPGFQTLDEESARELLRRAFDAWFEGALSKPPEAVRRILRRRAARPEADARPLLFDACLTLAEHRDFDAPWSRPPFDRDGRIDALISDLDPLAALASAAKSPRDGLAKNFDALRHFSNGLAARERRRPRDYDALEHQLIKLAKDRDAGWKLTGRGEWYAERIRREELLSRRDTLKASLDAFVVDAGADLAACLQRDLRPVIDAYEALKGKAGALDFLDLLLRARDLVRHDSTVRRELQGRLTHLFVDEFQDTDPLQAELLLLLAADDATAVDTSAVHTIPGKLFVVGDPKQAIYRFRRADVAFYERVKRQLLASGAELVELTTSFRSLPAIQAVVNVSFAPVMQGADDGSQARYVPLDHFRAPRADQPAVIALPVPDPYGQSYYGQSSIAKSAIERSFPDAVGAFVAWLVNESGWTVAEADSQTDAEKLVPIAPRHVCLLFRRFQSFGNDVTRPYVRALEARRIGHVLVGGRSFHEREEVTALRTALHAIEWPDDELSVYATLHGPFFGFADDVLFAFRSARGRIHPLQTRPAAAASAPASDAPALAPDQNEVAEALELLRRLHVSRNRRPIATTIEQLLAATRAHAALAIWPTGEQALANVLGIADSARRFETRGTTSFRAFVDFLDEQAERGEGEEAPVIEEGADGVRLLTVHRAKGLEFPVVVLCDPTAPLKQRDPSRYVDADRRLWALRLAGCVPRELSEHRDDALAHDNAESIRLGYVAATRARDLLVVPVLGDGPDPKWKDGWVSVLEPAIYPERRAWRSAVPAPSCPPFRGDSVRVRSGDSVGLVDECVAPGLHSGCAGGYGVVWWDPNALRLDVEPAGGLRQMELLVDDGSTGASAAQEGIRAHEVWAQQHAAALARGSIPTAAARTVTELAAAGAAATLPPSPLQAGALPAGQVRVERTSARRDGRPGGARFGTLVHAVLAEVAFDANADDIETLAKAVGRVVSATDGEVRGAVDAVSAALEQALMRRAAEAEKRGDCRREVPVALWLDDGTIVEGVVDLAFRERDGASWEIVDFKTDAEIDTSGAYLVQLRAYERAVGGATEISAVGVLLAV